MKTLFWLMILSGSLSPEQAQFKVDLPADLQTFSQQRYALEQKISEELDLPIPPKAHDFFQAAIAGHESNVTNRFALLHENQEMDERIPALQNALFPPIHEVLGIYEQWDVWKKDSDLLNMCYAPILNSMPSGSIYFGGTDPGRFVVTMMNEVEGSNLFCITQNALADNNYLSYLRYFYGKRLRLPSDDDARKAFQQFVGDVQAGRGPPGADIKIENGRVQVSGALSVMAINAILVEWIFDWNKDTHDFYVEESYVIPWMYPYLRPHGYIMKLEKEPLPSPNQNPQLWKEIEEQDTAYWDKLVAGLKTHQTFQDNLAAKKTFSKMRSAIAGLYLNREMIEQAKYAFRQAIELYPESPEASFRLAELYKNLQQYDKAAKLIEDYLKHDKDNNSAQEFLTQLRQLEAENEKTVR